MQQNLVEQPDPAVQQDTLVYADIGPSSLNKSGKELVTLKPSDTDDRVEYAVLNHTQLQKPDITPTIAGEILSLNILVKHYYLANQPTGFISLS